MHHIKRIQVRLNRVPIKIVEILKFKNDKNMYNNTIRVVYIL